MDYLDKPENAILIPVIVGIIEILKRIGMPSVWAPYASLVLGLAGSYLYLAPDDHVKSILYGIILALASVGLWSGTRSVIQSLKPKNNRS